jgi:hypothetical protein
MAVVQLRNQTKGRTYHHERRAGGDGGVDVRAMDLDPIRGGKLVIQVRRYRSTIPPAPSVT